MSLGDISPSNLPMIYSHIQYYLFKGGGRRSSKDGWSYLSLNPRYICDGITPSSQQVSNSRLLWIKLDCSLHEKYIISCYRDVIKYLQMTPDFVSIFNFCFKAFMISNYTVRNSNPLKINQSLYNWNVTSLSYLVTLPILIVQFYSFFPKINTSMCQTFSFIFISSWYNGEFEAGPGTPPLNFSQLDVLVLHHVVVQLSHLVVVIQLVGMLQNCWDIFTRCMYHCYWNDRSQCCAR